MGEVYRARDTRLNRDVAIKALPAEFAADPERLTRFQREARLLASLNHANVAAIYGLEEADGASYLVLEIVEGESLAQKLAAGPLPFEEALAVCAQIAAGVSAAHEAGVIHRDLKPGNVMLRPDGPVKILDFGLAKSAEAKGPASDLSDSPTVTHATHAGVILGTAAYMSPEQARGLALDKRTDIWSFGCILYECLTGRQVFRDDTVSDTLAAILRGEPDWSVLPAETPPRIRDLLRRCLQKDPKRRLHDIADARLEIEEALASPQEAILSPSTAAARGAKGKVLLAWIAAGAAGILVGVLGSRLLSRERPREVRSSIRSSIRLPAETFLRSANVRPSLAISPDGRKLVFRAAGKGPPQLYLRDLGRDEAVPIAGTRGALDPFFSPDGEWIAFFAQNELRKVAVSGGTPSALSEAPPVSVGGTWASDGTIVFAPRVNAGLARLALGAKRYEFFAEPDPARGEHALVFPQILPGEQEILVVVRSGRDFDDHAASSIAVHSLKTGKRKVLVEGATFARYVPGHLLFSRGTTVLAAPCDPKTWSLTGPAVPLFQDVLTTPYDGMPYLAVSDNGLVAWAPGGLVPIPTASVVWVDRTGKEEALPITAQYLKAPRLSPDGKRFAMESNTPQGSPRTAVFVYDFGRGVLSNLTPEPGRHFCPIWSPDGRRIAFSTFMVGSPAMRWKATDGSGPAEALSDGKEKADFPSSWSPDGRNILFTRGSAGKEMDLWLFSAEGKREKKEWITGPAREFAGFFSPDGRLVAYVSSESGRNEVYVTPFPGPGPRIKVSTDGGAEPAWAPSGREIFYRNFESLMAVPIETQPELSAGSARAVFRDEYEAWPREDGGRNYDVSPDGSRFLMIKGTEAKEVPITHLNLLTNWQSELPAADPAKR
jgi:Tol biopolymer transport system component